MPRPHKWRRVEFEPTYTYFKPAGVPKRDLEELVLSVEEVEALRLKDLEGLEQEECAQRMEVSRPTFQRVLSMARVKLSQAIIEGKAIKIAGGNYRLSRVHCEACQREHDVAHGKDGHAPRRRCPFCGYGDESLTEQHKTERE